MIPKILLVEDETLIAYDFAQVIRGAGYEVIIVSSGEAAVSIAESDSDISLILMDVDLGKGMDGIETAEHILAEKKIPLFFVTSYSEREIRDKATKLTQYGYCSKSSRIQILLESIKASVAE